jgi:hypothetical protein
MNLEHALSQVSLPLRERLSRHDFLHFRQHRALRLHSERGTLWVTLDGEPDDIQIDAGSSRVFDGRAAITVGTLGGDALVSATPLAPEPGWPQRLRMNLQQWLLQTWRGWAL